MRSSRKLADKIEEIDDDAELAQVRRQARTVIIKAFLAALPLILISVALPR